MYYKAFFSNILLVFVFSCSSSQTPPKNEIKENDKKQLNTVLHKINASLGQSQAFGLKLSDKTTTILMEKFKSYPDRLRQLTALKKQRVVLMKEIDQVISYFIKYAGINPNHQLTSPYKVKIVEHYMLQKRQAYQLETKMNAYVDFINEEYKHFDIPKFDFIAKSNQENPLYDHLPDEQKKDFAYAYFYNTPIITAITYLMHFQNIVLRYEEEVMKYMILSLVNKR